MFLKAHKSSTNVKAQHQERCGQFSAILAFISLIFVGVMLYLAITSQFSEQKTVYYILFVISLILFIGLTGLSIYSVLKSIEKKQAHRNYQLNQRSLSISRNLSQSNLNVRYDQELNAAIQNSLKNYNPQI